MRAFTRRLSLISRPFSISTFPPMSYPSTIQVISIAKNGGPEVIEKTVVPFPTVEPNHIVLKVEYSGVNFIDTYFRQGLYPAPKFPYVLGKEAGGVIVGLPTDATILDNPEYQKLAYKQGVRVAAVTQGALAEYISVPWKDVHPIPDGIPTRSATSVFLQGLTAITFMEEAYDVKKGDIILIHTIAGGLGLLFCQYAKYRGATVIGTTSTDEKAEIAKQHGADHVIIYKKEDTAKRMLEITNGEGVHAVFDGVGKDTFESDFVMLRRKGTLVSVGNASGPVPPVAPLKLTEKNLKLARPTLMNYAYTLDERLYYFSKLWSLVESGALRINIHKDYPFTAEGVQQSHKDLAGGKTVGKLLIKISE